MKRAALVVAHPGHELRVHGWLEQARPIVCILTDGSGHAERSRIGSSRALLGRADAEIGPVFGRLADRDAYAALLNHDHDLFIRLADELAEWLVREDVSMAAGDALEGYNPIHDVCRMVLNAAVRLARRRIRCYDFSLVDRPDVRRRGIRVRLDTAAFARKIAAARSYAELAGELDAAVGKWGVEAFREEWLRPVDPSRRSAFPHKPFYESYGERQVAAGRYREVVRQRDHLRPLAESLRHHVSRSLRWTRCGS